MKNTFIIAIVLAGVSGFQIGTISYFNRVDFIQICIATILAIISGALVVQK